MLSLDLYFQPHKFLVKFFNIENSCFAGSLMEEDQYEEREERKKDKDAKNKVKDGRGEGDDDAGGDGGDGEDAREG